MSDKPPFDPTKAFQAADEATGQTAPSKPAFDPTQKFDVAPEAPLGLLAKEEAEQGKISEGQHAARMGAAQGITAGYAPQIVGAAKAMTGQDYLKSRDEASQGFKQAQSAHPIQYGLGQVGGAALPMLATAGGAAPAEVGLAGSALRGGVAGAGMGLVSNPGDVEGKYSGAQIPERLEAAKSGGLMGAALGGAGKAVTSVAQGASKAAEGQAFKAAGAMLKDYRAAYGQNKVNEIGREALDKGIVQAGDTVESIAQKAESARKDIGSKLNDIYSSVKDKMFNQDAMVKAGPEGAAKLVDSLVSPKKVADTLAPDLQSSLAGKVGGKQTLERLNGVLEDLKENGDVVDITKAHDIMTDLDANINYDKLGKDPSKPYQDGLKQIRDAYRDAIDNHINTMDEVLGGKQLQELKTLNKSYSNVAPLAKISKDKAFREQANNALGLTDKMIGASAMGAGLLPAVVHGNPSQAIPAAALGLGAAVGSKMARKYGNAAAAGLLNRIPNLPNVNPAAVGLIPAASGLNK